MPLIHPALLQSVQPAPTAPAATRAGVPFVPERFLVDEPRELELPDLRDLVAGLAAAEHLWRPLVRHDPRRRWYTRLVLSGAVEVWLIGWCPGQQTDIHDHGGALGALAVAAGVLDEDECGRDWSITRTRQHGTGAVAGFGTDHVHRIVNRGQLRATTIHAYSPPELPLRYAPRQLAPLDQPVPLDRADVSQRAAQSAVVAAGAGAARVTTATPPAAAPFAPRPRAGQPRLTSGMSV
ncbi:cysteine dioxygenase [Parafrankia sp. EUN1f]|uniref:cysteine dioxygenase n=1 Tax=Parafrankia sp. EUN1f TaxID=102897 RepID=UPI0001C455E1|nr:cysteine dioxygenase [Parafrankia sp. EUN1f]EFC84365.1 cysteine dioxygenase type I [Parafrankia sp. EUN1f]